MLAHVSLPIRNWQPMNHWPHLFRPARWMQLCLLLALTVFASCRPEPARSHPAANAAAETNEVDELGDELAAKLAERRRSAGPAAPLAGKKAPPAPARTPTAAEQRCFHCAAKGRLPCRAKDCDAGHVPCPGPCVRPGKGTWVPNPSRPGELGYKLSLGNRRSAIVTMAHIGEVWVAKNGEPVSLGACPTCNRQMRVPCRDCAGTGHLACEVCQGATIIPSAWKPTDNPWFNAQPDVVRLRDGRVFLGKESGGDGETILFRTRSGEVIQAAKSEVLPTQR